MNNDIFSWHLNIWISTTFKKVTRICTHRYTHAHTHTLTPVIPCQSLMFNNQPNTNLHSTVKTLSWLHSQSDLALVTFGRPTSLKGSNIMPLNFYLSQKNYVHTSCTGCLRFLIVSHLTPEVSSTALQWWHAERGLKAGKAEQVTVDKTRLLTAS